MRAGTRKRLTGACDTLIAAAAVLMIVAVHWPWFQATITPPDMVGLVMAPSGTATGLYADSGPLWAATWIAAVQLALLLVRYFPGGSIRVPGDGVFLALGSGLICFIVAFGVVGVPGPWADIMSINGTWQVPFPWWQGGPDLLDGATMVMTMRYGAPVAAAAALTSLISAVVSPGPPAILLYRHRNSLRETATD